MGVREDPDAVGEVLLREEGALHVGIGEDMVLQIRVRLVPARRHGYPHLVAYNGYTEITTCSAVRGYVSVRLG